ncbi:YheC/YheD family endospore coat-associated protein [Thermoflavimicrobium dichotomicum]|uniref:YheC/D like ATP-grasp n=1 Tax=Thermoflavimicrobium dichotomicum TaxID=46223 RepID=A0A1I3LFG0_9BACL|nr:YheC/YheD family protein [Thermoflavimicrobium dichotomicum]SFI83115.1 YheC/D like ATP-grasp [Thermoflavimicrobium dichotomicum]
MKTNPRIAIFTADGGSLFRGNRQNFIDIILTGKKMGCQVFVLTPQGLHDDRSFVTGYIPIQTQGKRKWKKAHFPMPDVVYNRVPNRELEKTPEVQHALETLKSIPHIHLFNPHFFDKWTLYQQLSSINTLHPFLPETVLLHFPTSLKSMLFKYALLYLKPIHSLAGVGMIRIMMKDKKYEMIYQTKKQKKKFYLSSFQDTWGQVKQLCEDTPYLIQQGIPLATYQGRPFDIRILVQKDGTGNWGVTGIGVRVAGKEAISTHVPMGGKIENIHVVLKSVFGTLHRAIYEKLEKHALSFAKGIENKQNTMLGEISMDIGIDQKAKLWFFEANAKPMKFDEPEIRQRSLKRIIEYSQFLYQTQAKTEEVQG